MIESVVYPIPDPLIQCSPEPLCEEESLAGKDSVGTQVYRAMGMLGDLFDFTWSALHTTEADVYVIEKLQSG